MSIDAETLAVYEAEAAKYADLVTQKEDPRLTRFIGGLAKGAKVLDLGCGPGNASAIMMKAGLNVVALDPSPEMARIAAERFGIMVKNGSFEDVTETGVYDAVWASFSLLHAPREMMPQYLAAIHTALKPAGAFAIGLKSGTGSQRDRKGRLYAYYEQDELEGLLTEAGFTPESVETGRDAGLDGSIAPWIYITAHA